MSEQIDWNNPNDPEIKSAIARIKIYQLALLDRMGWSMDDLINALHDCYNQALSDGFNENLVNTTMQGATYLLMANLEYADSHSTGITSKSALGIAITKSNQSVDDSKWLSLYMNLLSELGAGSYGFQMGG